MPRLLKSSFYFPFQVTIDDREPALMGEEFRKIGNMIIRRQRLLAGDYLLDGDLLVERKTIPDFCQSIKDGRLFQQAKKLSNSSVPACLILEGKSRHFRTTDFSQQAIQGLLLSISLGFRIPIVRTKNPGETVRVMLQCFKQLTKDRPEDVKFYRRPPSLKKKHTPLQSQKIQLLENLPAIGPYKAKSLLLEFGNLQRVFTAEDTELRKVPGLGKKTVERLIDVLKK